MSFSEEMPHKNLKTALADFFKYAAPTSPKFKGDMTIAELYLNDLDKIIHAYELLSDNKSKSVYINELFLPLNTGLYGDEIAHQLAKHLSKDEEANYKERASKKFHDILNLFTNNQLQDSIESNVKPSVIAASISNVFSKEQYKYQNANHNPPVEIKPQAGDICIDCGGYIGDTALWFITKCQAAKVYSFEMMPENLEIFNHMLDSTSLREKIQIVPSAVSNEESEMYVIRNQQDSSSNSLILEPERFKEKYGEEALNSTLKMQVTTLDKFCKDNNIKPDFIKMDIEGAEINAVMGAREILKTFGSTLGLSAYHKADHLYKLILLVHSINSNYKFYMDRYRRYNETVLFCKI